MPAKDARLTSERAPSGANTATHDKQQDRNDAGGGREVDPNRLTRCLDTVAKPGQRPDQIGNDGREQDDQHSRKLQQRSDDRRRLARAHQAAAGLAETVDKARQDSSRPADAETLQAAAMQQEERDDRECKKEQPGVEALGGQPRNQQRQQQDCSEQVCQVDPPTLRLRIKAVHQLGELRLYERPACADRMTGMFGKACVAVGAAPDCVDQQEFQRGNRDEPQQQNARDREQDVGRRIEQPGAQEADEAGGLDRRGTLGNELLADESGCRGVAHPPMLRPIRQP